MRKIITLSRNEKKSWFSRKKNIKIMFDCNIEELLIIWRSINNELAKIHFPEAVFRIGSMTFTTSSKLFRFQPLIANSCLITAFSTPFQHPINSICISNLLDPINTLRHVMAMLFMYLSPSHVTHFCTRRQRSVNFVMSFVMRI